MKAKRKHAGTVGLHWAAQIKEALGFMSRAGYTAEAQRRCRRIWEEMARFAGDEKPSLNIVHLYLVAQGLSGSVWAAPLKSFTKRRHVAAAARLLIRQMGWDRDAAGAPGAALPEKFRVILTDYERYCAEYRRYRPATLYSRIRQVEKFLIFTSARLGGRLEKLKTADLSAFIVSRSKLAPTTVASYVSAMRMFFRYLWTSEILPDDLSLFLPKVRIFRDARVPAVWTEEEVRAILAAVDRESPKGKRDYAILLLASRLGLRSKDIRDLRLENLHWTEARIVIRQSKTGVLLALPLLDEIAEAIVDYLQSSRPNSPHREVFLRMRPPFAPLASGTALCCIVDTYRMRAGITAPQHGHASLHSLRYTLASRLLREGTSIDTISHILGHSSVGSSLLYARVETQGLRSAGLDPDAACSKEASDV